MDKKLERIWNENGATSVATNNFESREEWSAYLDYAQARQSGESHEAAMAKVEAEAQADAEFRVIQEQIEEENRQAIERERERLGL
jgi:hypothetical protein